MKPEFILINWWSGVLVGSGTEAECREQLRMITAKVSEASQAAYLIAEVKVLSQLKRIES